MALPTILMQAPPTFGGTISGTPSGTTYVPSALGQVSALYADVGTLENIGFYPVPTPGYAGVLGYLLGANMNVTTDQQIPLLVSSIVHFRISKITVTNASVSLTTAVGGVYDAASKGGNAIVASSQAYSALTAATRALDLTLALNLREPAGTSLYFSLSTAQGAAATADVYVFGEVLQQ
jgi:hypothetical protein